jgi:hypothetical protein
MSNDFILVELTRLRVDNKILKECLFGALSNLLSPEQLKTLEINYHLRLLKQNEEALNRLEGEVTSSYLAKQSFEDFSAIRDRLRDLDYNEET